MINDDWHSLVYQGMATVPKSSLITGPLLNNAVKRSLSDKWRFNLLAPINIGYLYLKVICRIIQAELYIRGVHWALIHCRDQTRR